MCCGSNVVSEQRNQHKNLFDLILLVVYASNYESNFNYILDVKCAVVLFLMKVLKLKQNSKDTGREKIAKLVFGDSFQ